MKAFFIYKDGGIVGSQVGYTTRKGALKSLVGSVDWYKELRKYEYKQPHEITDEDKAEGIFKQNPIDVGSWCFCREAWSRKIWGKYVEEHYEIVEKEFDIVFL